MMMIRLEEKVRLGTNKGQSLAEYGLILALVCVVSIGGLQAIGQSLNTQLGQVSSQLMQVQASPATQSAGSTAVAAGVTALSTSMLGTASPGSTSTATATTPATSVATTSLASATPASTAVNGVNNTPLSLSNLSTSTFGCGTCSTTQQAIAP